MHVESDGGAGLAAARGCTRSAIVLDVGLPAMDGTEVCRRLRADGDWTPVLFVTARDDEVDRVLGLELGADDYVTKPFSPRELVARVKAVLRRSGTDAGRSDAACTSSAGDRRPGSPRGYVDGRPRSTLTATEFDLLAFLMPAARPGVRARAAARPRSGATRAAAGTRTVDVHVAQLRGQARRREPDPYGPRRRLQRRSLNEPMTV